MKYILGHKSRDLDEIVDIFRKTGTYTCPSLPHYRYDKVKRNCSKLWKAGLIRKSGKTSTGINFVTTPIFQDWEAHYISGCTNLNPVNWTKEKYKNAKTENRIS